MVASNAPDDAVAPSADTLPAPGSNGVAPVETTGPDEAEYGGAEAIVADVPESSILPSGIAADGALTAVVVVVVVVALFIEVGPISVVLNGVSALPLDDGVSYTAPGFSGPGGDGGPPYGAFRSAAGETGIEKLGL